MQPGDVSWMTAGAGVAHVERTPAERVASGSRIHGLQVWLALPREEEERAPSYSHHSAASLPQQDALGVRIRLVAGSGFCLESPVPVLSPTLYADVHMEAGATLLVPTEHPQRAVYLLDGEVLLDDQPLAINTLTVLPEGVQFSLAACGSAHLVIIGGAPLDGPRRMNWNFVSSDPQRIDAARARWAAGDWPHVPGETTRIELPR